MFRKSKSETVFQAVADELHMDVEDLHDLADDHPRIDSLIRKIAAGDGDKTTVKLLCKEVHLQQVVSNVPDCEVARRK